MVCCVSSDVWFKFSENGALQQSRVGYQLNAAVRAAALDACELLRKLLPPLGIRRHSWTQVQVDH